MGSGSPEHGVCYALAMLTALRLASAGVLKADGTKGRDYVTSLFVRLTEAKD